MGTESENHGGNRSDPDASRLYEERLKTLLELSNEWYWDQDEHHRFTLIVGASFGQTGIDPQEYLGRSRWDHDALPVGDGGPCKSDGGLEIGMMCSLSIPIITICALLLLMIIVFLLDFIFRWIPFFIFCFPLPKFKSKD